MRTIDISNTIKDQAHDKAFANIHSCELDIRRLKEEIKADIHHLSLQNRMKVYLEWLKKN